MVRDHDEIYDELLEEKREEKRLESVRGQQKKGSTAKPPEKNSSPSEDMQYPTPTPKKTKSVVKIAALRAGGSVSSASKRADGIAMKGKTKGRIV
jgi:hypothetical protein